MSTTWITSSPTFLTGTSEGIPDASSPPGCEELRRVQRTGGGKYDVFFRRFVFHTILNTYKGLMVEWEFINNLSYRSQLTEEQSHFVKLMYRTKLKKVSICLRFVNSELTDRIYTFARLLKLVKS
jgi:hypothetical protein